MLMLDRALRYATAGWPVFPLAPGTKVPLVQSAHGKGSSCRGECGLLGHGLYDATTDADTIRKWWSDDGEPGANIGLRAGIRWWVLDVDRKPPRGGGYTGPEMLALLEEQHGALPATLSVRTTSGGEHRFFRLPTDRSIPSRARIKAPDGRTSSLDVRGPAAVVAEPRRRGQPYPAAQGPHRRCPSGCRRTPRGRNRKHPPRRPGRCLPPAPPRRRGSANACNTILSAGEESGTTPSKAAAAHELKRGRAVSSLPPPARKPSSRPRSPPGMHREAYRTVRDGSTRRGEPARAGVATADTTNAAPATAAGVARRTATARRRARGAGESAGTRGGAAGRPAARRAGSSINMTRPPGTPKAARSPTSTTRPTRLPPSAGSPPPTSPGTWSASPEPPARTSRARSATAIRPTSSWPTSTPSQTRASPCSTPSSAPR